jgi:hypothetical protein
VIDNFKKFSNFVKTLNMATQKKHNTTSEAILKRLEEFLQALGTGDTLSDITGTIGVSPSYFSTIRSKQAEVGVDKIVKILSLYPQLSADWLLLGSGLMHKTADSLKSQSELLAKEKMLKSTISGLADIQSQIQQLQTQISKTKPLKAKSGRTMKI